MRILLIEDDEVLRQVMLKSLVDAGHRVDAAADLGQPSNVPAAGVHWLSLPLMKRR